MLESSLFASFQAFVSVSEVIKESAIPNGSGFFSKGSVYWPDCPIYNVHVVAIRTPAP